MNEISTRARLLDAAARIFLERGYAEASMDQVRHHCRAELDTAAADVLRAMGWSDSPLEAEDERR